jgi:nitrate/nitrite transport system ATP-binding protein
VCIFKDATIKIEKGEFVTCIGHSGCGKSTLLNIIAGLETPTEGGIILNGREASGPGLDRMVVFQNFALMPWMTVFENIALAVRSAYPDWSREQVSAHVTKYIELVGLKGAENKRPVALSGGMKQRVGLARAFSIEPKVLLLDEPFAQIDALTRGVIQEELIQMWNNSRNTVFMVTHDVDEAILLSDRILLTDLRRGLPRKYTRRFRVRDRGKRSSNTRIITKSETISSTSSSAMPNTASGRA